MADDRTYDAVIVGAGIAGLTSAAYLSKAGYRVLLCEKNEKPGGLVSSFQYRGFTFDGGIRAFENSGVIFPMLRQLGMEIPFVRNPVSIGVEDTIVKLRTKESLSDYRMLLCSKFPGSEREIDQIIIEIKRAMQYMDILYGIDNPLFMDYKSDKKYIFKTLLPWLVRYHVTMPKIKDLQEPINLYLRRITKNQPLIDMITQHFFTDTPAFFALSYFGLYLDYSYPKGGTGIVVDKMAGLIRKNGGEIAYGTEISGIHADRKELYAKDGRTFCCRGLIWCADMKSLYLALDTDSVRDPAVRANIGARAGLVKNNKGGNSVLTLFVTADLPKSYFEGICGCHIFYTPRREGISGIGPAVLPLPAAGDGPKSALLDWVSRYLSLTTYEISCPSLRDDSLAPQGMTGVIISTLMDYQLVKSADDSGWYDELKSFCEDRITAVLDKTLFPGFTGKIRGILCSTPLTLERMTGNAGGAITGWAFTNRKIPAVREFTRIAQSVLTPVPGIYQAGQWTFSPSGLPVSVMTAKFAADAVSKELGPPPEVKRYDL